MDAVRLLELVVEHRVTTPAPQAAAEEHDTDQAWFWTPEWQQKEREADEDIAAGRTTFYANEEAFLAALDHE